MRTGELVRYTRQPGNCCRTQSGPVFFASVSQAPNKIQYTATELIMLKVIMAQGSPTGGGTSLLALLPGGGSGLLLEQHWSRLVHCHVAKRLIVYVTSTKRRQS
jgi:hypothetical protein